MSITGFIVKALESFLSCGIVVPEVGMKNREKTLVSLLAGFVMTLVVWMMHDPVSVYSPGLVCLWLTLMYGGMIRLFFFTPGHVDLWDFAALLRLLISLCLGAALTFLADVSTSLVAWGVTHRRTETLPALLGLLLIALSGAVYNSFFLDRTSRKTPTA